MNKQYEAYYSPNWACIWLFLSIIFIIDDVLILQKRNNICSLKGNQKIDIHDAGGSFDIIIKSVEKNVSLHCFIQNQRQKTTLIDLLKNKGVNVSTYDLL